MDSCPYTGQPCDKPKTIKLNQNSEEYQCCNECTVGALSQIFNLLKPVIFPQSIILNNLKKLSRMEKLLTSDERCLGCGYGLSDIQETGKLGCPDCYSVFKNQVKTILPYMHAGKKIHVGKNPKLSQLTKLKNDLANAIQQEKYEEAAQLRDSIKQLEERFNGNNLKSPETRIEENPI